MATTIRNTNPVLPAMRDMFNALKKQIGGGAAFHLDAAETDRQISSANASDLATSLVLVNELRAKYALHVGADNAGAGMAHKVQDVTNVVSAAVATDLATGITLGNAIKTAYEAHRASTTYHQNADSTNTIAASNASDQSSLNTLLNELKGDFNAHMASAPTNSAPSIRLVDA